MGRQLAREHPVKADLVVPVPDSGNCAALGYSRGIGHSLRNGLRPQPLRGPQLSAALAAHPRFDVRVKLNLIIAGEGQAGGRGGRFHRARHHLQGARQ
jgi:amidophosphoribosyltransferase